MKGKWISHIFLFGAALIYGANYSIAKIILDDDYISPMGLVLLRVVTAAIVFFLFHSIFIKEKIKKQDYISFLLVALLGVVINQSCFIIGLKYTVPINAALIMTVVPIIVFIFSSFLLNEKISNKKILGVSFGFIGVLIIILKRGSFVLSVDTLKGDFLVFVNSVSYALYLVKVKPLLKRYNPVTITKWMFLFGLIFIFPIGISGVLNVNFSGFTPEIWSSLGYVLLFTTVLAYLFNILGLKNVNPSVVAIYIYLQPILATIVALLLGKDSLDFIKTLAALLIFTGVYLVSVHKVIKI